MAALAWFVSVIICMTIATLGFISKDPHADYFLMTGLLVLGLAKDSK